MKIPSLVKLPKYRSFEYRPRHYDPVMEDLKERVKKIEEEENGKDLSDGYKPNISFRSAAPAKSNKSSSFIRLIIIVFLCLDVFLYLQYGWGKAMKIGLLSEVFLAYAFVRFGKKFIGR